jgi:hypothetical protein
MKSFFLIGILSVAILTQSSVQPSQLGTTAPTTAPSQTTGLTQNPNIQTGNLNVQYNLPNLQGNISQKGLTT